MTWCSDGGAPATVIRRSQYDHKNVFVVFCRRTGPESIHMIDRGDTISGAYYRNNCLEPLFHNIRRRRPKYGLHAIKLHHDNASVHQTNDIKTFLQEQGVMVMSHPPYSLELTPSDFWLFGNLKRQLGSYSDFKSSQQAVTKTLRAIPDDEFRQTFNKWIERMQLCIKNKGDYFEHLMKQVFCKSRLFNQKLGVPGTFGSP